jgi:hypothetical protein
MNHTIYYDSSVSDDHSADNCFLRVGGAVRADSPKVPKNRFQMRAISIRHILMYRN